MNTEKESYTLTNIWATLLGIILFSFIYAICKLSLAAPIAMIYSGMERSEMLNNTGVMILSVVATVLSLKVTFSTTKRLMPSADYRYISVVPMVINVIYFITTFTSEDSAVTVARELFFWEMMTVLLTCGAICYHRHIYSGM